MSILQDVQNQDRINRFKLPQSQTYSPAINQANSEAMQSESAPEPTASNDIYSGAKQGVAQIRLGLNNQDDSDAADDVNQPTSNTGAPEKETTGVVSTPNVRTGLETGGLPYEQRAASMTDKAYAANSPDMQTLRDATANQAAKQKAYSEFDPTQQPVSKLRKGVGIATGIVGGVFSGNVNNGINAYHNITRMPAYEKQAQLKREADASGVEQSAADKQAEAARQFTQTGVNAANTLQNVGKDVEAASQFDLNAPQREAVRTKDIAEAKHADVQSIVEQRPPKPEITTAAPDQNVIRTGLDPVSGQWKSSNLQQSGAQKLNPEDEQIARGASDAAGLQPNDVIKGYREGDPKMSKFVSDAVAAYKKSQNAAFALGEPAQAIQFYDKDNNPKTLIFNPRSQSFKQVDEGALGIEGSTKGTGAKSLGATDENAFRGATNSIQLIDKINTELTPDMQSKLGAAAGRYNDLLVDKLGAEDPKLAALITDLRTLSALNASTHTGRTSEPIIKEFRDSIGGIKQHPENLKAKLNEVKASAEMIRKQITESNPNSSQVRADSVKDQPKLNIGDVVTLKDGSKRKVTSIHSDSSWDGDQVK